jgi:hypothetical protein
MKEHLNNLHKIRNEYKSLNVDFSELKGKKRIESP